MNENLSELTRQQFFAAIAPTIVLIRQQGSPILPSVRLAQSLLETGGVIHAWNNLGGIKVGSGKLTPYWRGDAVTKGTWEFINGQEVKEKAAFRAYRTLYHYFKDQDELFNNTRYIKVQTAKTALEQTEQLRLAGYATDPNYSSKIMSIIAQYNLDAFDTATVKLKPEIGFEGASIVPVMVDQLLYCTAYLEKGITYIPVRKIAELYGAKVEWKNKNVYVNGVLVNTRLGGSTSFVKPRDIMNLLKIRLEWDTYAKVLFIN